MTPEEFQKYYPRLLGWIDATLRTHAGDARTIASGLRVPRAIGDFMILQALRESRGTAVAVEDGELLDAMKLCGRLEGIVLCPEGAACLPALKKLVESGWIGQDEKVVVFNTGAGLKYLEVFD